MKNTDVIDRNGEARIQKTARLITKKEAYNESKRLLIRGSLLFSGMIAVVVVFFAFAPLFKSTLIEHLKNVFTRFDETDLKNVNMIHDLMMTVAQFVFPFLLVTALMMMVLYYLNFRLAKKEMDEERAKLND